MSCISSEPPAADLSRRAALTTLSGFLVQGVQFFIGIAITPFLARTVGQAEFGLWALLQQFNSYLSLGQFRVTGMLRLTLAAGQGRLSEADKRRHTAASLYLLCIFVGFCLLATVVASQHIGWFFTVPDRARTAAQITLVLLAIGFAASQFSTIPGAAVKGENLEYSMMGIRSVAVLGSSLLSALFVYLGWGLVGMGAGYALGYLVQCILYTHTARRVLPWFGLGEAGWKDVREQARGSGWLLVSSVGLLLASSFDLMLVGFIFDPSTAALYYVAGALCRFLQFPVSIAIGSTPSGLAGLFGNGEIARLNRTNRELAFLVLFVSGIAGCVVISLNDSFVHVWMGSNYAAPTDLAFAIVLSSLSGVFITSAINLFDAAVEFPHRTFYLISGAATGIASSIILGARYGLFGFALGQFAGRCVSWFLLNRFLSQRFGIRHPFPLRAAASVLALWLLCWRHPLQCRSWTMLVLYGAALSVSSAAALYFVGIPKEDKAAFTKRLAKLTERFAPRKSVAAG